MANIEQLPSRKRTVSNDLDSPPWPICWLTLSGEIHSPPSAPSISLADTAVDKPPPTDGRIRDWLVGCELGSATSLELVAVEVDSTGRTGVAVMVASAFLISSLDTGVVCGLAATAVLVVASDSVLLFVAAGTRFVTGA